MDADSTFQDAMMVKVPSPLPELPGHYPNVSIGDIPKKYFNEKPCLPYHGLTIDATYKDSMNCLHYIKTVKDSDRRQL